MYSIKGDSKQWKVGPFICKTEMEAIRLSWFLWHLVNT